MTRNKQKAKRSKSQVVVAIGKLVSFAQGRGRNFVACLLVLVVFLGGWYAVWCKVRQQVLSNGSYWLTQEKVETTQLPPWIHSNIRGEVFRDASLDGPLSILDDDLTQRVANAFSLHPWVAKVHRVQKHHPAGVMVELSYRKPACMVEVQGGLLPIDSLGVLLPSSDFSPIEARRYPRLVGVDSAPLGPVGTMWGDIRVAGGAEIAAAFGDSWQTFNLDRIVTLKTTRPGNRDQYHYELYTRRGTRIIWGLAPRNARNAEVAPKIKVARLKDYVEQRGSLEGSQGPQLLDVSGQHALRDLDSTVMKKSGTLK